MTALACPRPELTAEAINMQNPVHAKPPRTANLRPPYSNQKGPKILANPRREGNEEGDEKRIANANPCEKDRRTGYDKWLPTQ